MAIDSEARLRSITEDGAITERRRADVTRIDVVPDLSVPRVLETARCERRLAGPGRAGHQTIGASTEAMRT